MSQFVEQIRKFRVKVEAQGTALPKAVALDLLKFIVETSPHITGRFKANNIVSLNAQANYTTTDLDKDGGPTIAKGFAALSSFKPGDSIWISNSVEYAALIEFFETSVQAPRGVYRIAIGDLVANYPAIARAFMNWTGPEEGLEVTYA